MSVLVVNDTPILSGLHKDILTSTFAAFGEKFAITNVFPRMEDKELRKLRAEDWLSQSKRLRAEARGHKKILVCGALAASAVFERETTVPITRVRGRGFLTPNGKYAVCTYQPKTVIADQDFFRDMCFDIEKLLTHNGPMEQPENEILSLDRKKDLRLLRELHNASFIACDIETTTFNPYHAEILGIGFTVLNIDGTGYTLVVPQWNIGREVEKLLRTFKRTFVFHNAKFDVQHLWRKFGRFDFHDLADTMLMNWALDERPFSRYKAHGLDLLQRLYFDTPPKSVNMGEWLEEYFREDVGNEARYAWIMEQCETHPEKVRNWWRRWHIETYGEEADWRGRKVIRDIAVKEVSAACIEQMPKKMQPVPTKKRKAEMWEEMMRYMGEDCFSTARLYPILKEKMTEESEHLWRAHTYFDIPASNALAAMEARGAPVNLPYLLEMKTNIEKELAQEVLDIRAVVQELTTHPKGAEFNPNSSKQVKEVLYDVEMGLGLKMPKGVGRYAYKRDPAALTTNSDTLKVLARQVAKDRPAISKLISNILSFRVRSKILGTYIQGILDRVDEDGRVRGDFNLHGTATARISCSNPNLQNIPDASHVGYDIRKAYVPSEDWVILEADYSQLELRVAALFSQDEVMLEAYRNGADIHQEVAYMLWQKPKDEITKYERYLAKCMNFGVIYGRGARSIATGPEMDNLVEMSGRSWGNSEIDAYFAKFKVGYKDLFEWMELVKRDSMAKQYVESPTGHRRRFDLILDPQRGHIERQTVNTPIQGFAARMTIHALSQMDKKFDPEIQQILFTVHDSIMVQCVNDRTVIKDTAELIQSIMENDLPVAYVTLPVLPHAPFKPGDRLLYNLPLVADVTVGPSWAECKDEAEHYVVRTLEDELEPAES